jgi:hypothetical protein
MAKVYLSSPLAPDDLVGIVNHEGDIFLQHDGDDQYVGRVDLATGKVYQTRFGPDDYCGHVALESGKVYRHRRLLPDQHLGTVHPDGRLLRTVAGGPDEAVAHVEDMPGLAYGGGAMLLLVLPALDEAQMTDSSDAPAGADGA